MDRYAGPICIERNKKSYKRGLRQVNAGVDGVPAGRTLASMGSEVEGRPVRERLLDLLARHAYRYDPSKPFRLASGEMSDEYVDCKKALALPEGIHALAAVVHPEVLASVEAIGGLTMGADPIAISVSQYSHSTSRPVRW